MKVLGVSYGYHDASACLVVDGRVVAASAEERFTRQKHDANFPTWAIEYCLAQGGVSVGALDQVVFHEDPHAKFSRVLTASLAPFPDSRREFVNAIKAWLGRKLWSLNTLSSRLDVEPERISYLSHHYSHAVQAFLGSGFKESAILIVDAVGDWACTALYRGAWVDGRPKLERVLELAFPHSLGLVYSAFTAYLGFSPNDSEASTMALAGFGKPRFADQVRKIVSAASDGTYTVDQSYFHFANFYRGAYSAKFLAAFGPARAQSFRLPQSCLAGEPSQDPEGQRFADIAASVQLVLEERILELCTTLRAAVPSDNLCYAGGVSLNCVANQKILTRGPFRNVYVPPDPGDGGTSVGTALSHAAMHGACEPLALKYTPYLGAAFDERPAIEMLPHVKPDHVQRYLKRGHSQPPGLKWEHQVFTAEDALCDEVARRVLEGRIVGWCQGRAELGPRALGNRSILIRPDDLALAERLSRAVKDRALYRPYAFSITSADAPKVLDCPAEHLPFNRWMQYAVPVRPEARAQVRAALHVDDTTRPQVCFPEDNPRFHRLLETIGRTSGLSVVLNTSFNPSGYPIVSTPLEALSMFARTDMDALVMNDTLVWKQ